MIYSTTPRTKRLFHAGVIPNMLVNNQFLKCVTFLFVDKQGISGRTERVPIATTFLVSVPIGNDLVQIHAVTARHVIEASRQYGDLFIRLKLQAGKSKDVVTPQDKWICHMQTDVAVIPIEIPDECDLKVIPFENLAPEEYIVKKEVGIGDDVFFVGLFSGYSGQKHDRPVVRFGNISLMHEEMPLRLDPTSEHTTQVDAYLIESRSWGGHSGSPVFIYFPVTRKPGMIAFGGDQFALLGLTHGHFDLPQNVKLTGDLLGSVEVLGNAGIAAVIPAEKIRETMMEEQLVEERKRALQEYQKHLPTPTPDMQTNQNGTITQQQFHKILDKASKPFKKSEKGKS